MNKSQFSTNNNTHYHRVRGNISHVLLVLTGHRFGERIEHHMLPHNSGEPTHGHAYPHITIVSKNNGECSHDQFHGVSAEHLQVGPCGDRLEPALSGTTYTASHPLFAGEGDSPV